MVRSMYAGVAGMKASQTRMDVIGNNIANVNTYGFKSSRATFRDMYYQQLRGASAGTATRGGINPSMVGYGSQIASIDLLMGQSAMSSTGNPMDVAITGEGFLQVMDADGNTFYTKAGMLDIDPATGALIDSNGNFVLGTSATDGKLDSTTASNGKILIKVAPVQAGVAKVSSEISGKTLTITSTNQTKAANIGFTFTKATDLPDGQRVKAVMDSTSSVINIKLNANELFSSMSDLQSAVNDAITEANGGAHPGGTFNFKLDPDPFDGGSTLTGAQIVDTASADYEGGGITLDKTNVNISADGSFLGGFKISSTGLKFTGSGTAKSTVTYEAEVTGASDPADNHVARYKVEVATDTGTYTGYVTQERADLSSGTSTVLLSKVGGDSNDTITMSYPNTSKINIALGKADGSTPGDGDNSVVDLGTATASAPTHNLGWGKGTFSLTGGTEFTEQDVGNLTGVSIGANGVIVGTSAAGQQVLGRIDLSTFGNPKGLMQSGNSYYTSTANSGAPKVTIAGENGTGALKNSALELSNVDLSQEFSDMITTQRGFQANSRLITVSDTMLEELINLKR